MKILLLNNNKHYLILSIIAFFLSLPSTILSQDNPTPTNISEKDLFDSINKYNQTNTKLDKLLPAFLKIKFNFIIKISFSKLMHMKNKIDAQIIDVQKKLDENKSNRINIEIAELYENMQKYDKKYNKLIDMYNRYEKLKNKVKKFFIIFFISIFIGIIIFAIFITIITIIVVKKQKKYYVLHEEATIENGKEVDIKIDNKDKSSVYTLRRLIKKDFNYFFPKFYENRKKH